MLNFANGCSAVILKQLRMANFNPYIDKIDMDFWRELCAKEGKLCFIKRVIISFIVEI